MGSCLQFPALASFSEGLHHDTISPVNPFLSNLLCSWCFFAAMRTLRHLHWLSVTCSCSCETDLWAWVPQWEDMRIWAASKSWSPLQHEVWLVFRNQLLHSVVGSTKSRESCQTYWASLEALAASASVPLTWTSVPKKSDRLTSINMELQTRCNGCWVINPWPIQKTSGDRFPLRQVIFNYSDMESLDCVRYRDMWWPPVRNVAVKLQLLIHCTQRKGSLWTWRVECTENSWYFYLSIFVIIFEISWEARETAQGLRAQTTSTKDLSSGPSNHVGWLTAFCNFSSVRTNSLFWPPRKLH